MGCTKVGEAAGEIPRYARNDIWEGAVSDQQERCWEAMGCTKVGEVAGEIPRYARNDDGKRSADSGEWCTNGQGATRG